jgi:hypothetical protein
MYSTTKSLFFPSTQQEFGTCGHLFFHQIEFTNGISNYPCQIRPNEHFFPLGVLCFPGVEREVSPASAPSLRILVIVLTANPVWAIRKFDCLTVWVSFPSRESSSHASITLLIIYRASLCIVFPIFLCGSIVLYKSKKSWTTPILLST